MLSAVFDEDDINTAIMMVMMYWVLCYGAGEEKWGIGQAETLPRAEQHKHTNTLLTHLNQPSIPPY